MYNYIEYINIIMLLLYVYIYIYIYTNIHCTSSDQNQLVFGLVLYYVHLGTALCSWLLTSGPAPFCLCKPFLCKACPGTIHAEKKEADRNDAGAASGYKNGLRKTETCTIPRV